MAQAIALMASAARGLFGASSHEPFHADGGQKPTAVTERGAQKPPQRHRDLPCSDRTVEQVVALPNRAYLDQVPPLRGTGPGVSTRARP